MQITLGCSRVSFRWGSFRWGSSGFGQRDPAAEKGFVLG